MTHVWNSGGKIPTTVKGLPVNLDLPAEQVLAGSEPTVPAAMAQDGHAVPPLKQLLDCKQLATSPFLSPFNVFVPLTRCLTLGVHSNECAPSPMAG
jgi:hypothetical protein